MHHSFQRDILIYLLIFILLIIGDGIYYRDFQGSNMTDPLAFEMSGVFKKTYTQTANVSTAVDTRMLSAVRNPCKDAYGIACGAWVKNGSYLVSNALAIHSARVERAVMHSAMRHPWINTMWNQCVDQLLNPLNPETLEYIQGLLRGCEPDGTMGILEQNLARVQCYGQLPVFPLLDWRNGTVGLSMWAADGWDEHLIIDSCQVVAETFGGSVEECTSAVQANVNILIRHAVASPNEKKITTIEWKQMTNNQLNITTGDDITLWNKEMFIFLLNAMNAPNFRYFLWAAVLGDLLQFGGHPHYFAMYSTVTSLQFAAEERRFPPSVYGWGPVGYNEIMVHREDRVLTMDDIDSHPDLIHSCLAAIGDIFPQGIDSLIYPPQATMERAEGVVEGVRGVFVDAIVNSEHLSEAAKETLGGLLRSMTIHIGNNPEIDIRENGTNFVHSVLLARRFNRNIHHLDTPGSFHFDTFRAVYDPEENHLFLPVAMVLFPYFRPDDQVELQYGRLGVVVATAMAKVFDRHRLHRVGLLSGLDFKTFSNSIDCFGNTIEGFDEVDTMGDVMGLEMALRGCQRVGGCSTAKNQITFFASYGQTMCANGPQAEGDLHRVPSFRVNTAAVLARNADGSGLAERLWYCSAPNSCAFWK